VETCERALAVESLKILDTTKLDEYRLAINRNGSVKNPHAYQRSASG
jgi:hypothetical protein